MKSKKLTSKDLDETGFLDCKVSNSHENINKQIGYLWSWLFTIKIKALWNLENQENPKPTKVKFLAYSEKGTKIWKKSFNFIWHY